MRWFYFVILQLIILSLVAAGVYFHQDKVTLVKTPPKELAKWYKPENKRHEWLHNMFKLRREMQAVEHYANVQNDKNLLAWIGQLSEHYGKIADMVPQWQSKLNIPAMTALANAGLAQDYNGVLTQLSQIQETCDTCHNDYQAITALMYRTPDFSNITLGDNNTLFKTHMNTLTKQVNQVKIFSQDGYTEAALSSLSQLEGNMNILGEACVDCHKRDRREYPDETMQATMASLKTAISSGSAKEQGRHLGTLAVLACARCHGTHRIVFGAKEKLTQEVDFKELIKHN
ncbi:multiheme c-type cytochrome [Litorilituus sediminis]|uniref:Uncharacterized protein n=1 Tax=Litorilituus sediminis TaxID=718192 RepID=A0A4P6PBJ0_9GAMM|nr:multiheme c-type cytochrome [Litorilituus sediminis]QBG37007.1 hypothetical protein EMK97_15395 [Litorilituus sediminis]